MMLDVVGAAVIGGTSLFGGRGSVAWTLSGAVFLTLMDNLLSLRGVPYHQILVIKGLVILAAAGLDVLRRHRAS
jgi:ribose/xylose/arabinose/galactoside ABC-type transport system permease subunit